MHRPAGIKLVTRRSRLNLRLRLIAAFVAGVLAVGCGAFVADPGYRATQLPDDVTELFEVQQVVANPDADTVWIFEQGGPSHEISNEVLFAFLRYRGHEDIHLVQAHQTLTLNPRLAARHARLSLANLQAEVDVSVELLRRVIDHFKAQHKRVVVVGYSYGSFLVARYLALHGPDGAANVFGLAMMANAWYEIERGVPFSPYFGIGAGATHISISEYGLDGSGWGFAYQAGVGVSFPYIAKATFPRPAFHFGLGYRLFGIFETGITGIESTHGSRSVAPTILHCVETNLRLVL